MSALLACGLALAGCGDSGGGGGAKAECAISESLKASLNEAATGEVAAFQVRAEPTPIGNLRFSDGNGAESGMSAFSGKTVLLNLWATWCVPCRKEMPALETLQKELGGDAFSVVPVSVDLGDDTKPKNFYAEIGLEALPFFHDGRMGVFNDLKKRSLAIGLPVSMLIDGKGCVLGVLNGPAEWASEDAKRLIGKALATRN